MLMTMKCRVCGCEVAADAPFGHCPKCLLQHGFTTSSDGPPREDDRSFGDYQLEEMIGRGGMGVVYKARQKSLNRLVALKMIQSWRDASLNTLVRFRLEAEAAAKLDHPNIVPTYHIGEQSGQPFFSMKLIPGASLGKQLKEWSLLPPEGDATGTSPRAGREPQVRIAVLMAKIARAVHYAHRQGVIHRDLKPSNILIDAAGEPHLTDFGIAKLLEQDSGLTGTHDVLGTPAYMAPEQANGRSVNAAVDIYSLGAILYSLLTGRPPFQGETPLETLRKVSEEEPVSPTRINRNADPELASISLKCLEKDPVRRYISALELAEDLDRWTRHEPVRARPAGPVLRLSRWVRRNPVGASLIGTLCLGLVGALVLLEMVDAEKNRKTAALRDVEAAKGVGDRATRQLVALLVEELESLWLQDDRKMLRVSSEQLAALSAREIADIPKGARVERLRFGLAANESPVSDARRYAELLSFLETRLSKRRGHPILIDLQIYKFKEDRVQAIVSGNLHFVRMGTIYFLQTKEEHPEIQALIEPECATKTATFFTRADSGIKSLASLKNRRLAFGDPMSGLSFWGQVKLSEAGVTGRDLAEYAFLDSRSEFIEEVHALGYQATTNRWGWLHSTADVIEDVLKGNYDVGVTSDRGFEKHKHRGLVRIQGSEFERRPSPWVVGTNVNAGLVRDFTEIMTGLRGEAFLSQLPDQPTGFRAITPSSHAEERAAMRQVRGLFPLPARANPTNQIKK